MNSVPLIPYPVYNIFININNSCNLNCSYCWYNATNNFFSHEEMSKEDFIQSLNIIKESIIFWKENNYSISYKPFRVAIATKEPLLSFYSLIKPVLDDFEFQDYFKIYLLTNGTLLTKEIVDWCIEKNIVIQISIDGCEDSHNTNRMHHQKIMENIKLIPNIKDNLFIVSTTDKNTIKYVKKNLEFFRDNFPDTLVKFNFNIFNDWTEKEWEIVYAQYQEFINENDISNLRFLNIYRSDPLFLDEGRGYIIGIDRKQKVTIKKPFHSSIPKLKENFILNDFDFGNIYNLNYNDWTKYYKTFGRNFANTRFKNLNDNCSNCEYQMHCYNCDYMNKKQIYYLNDNECQLKKFKRKIVNMINRKSELNDN